MAERAGTPGSLFASHAWGWAFVAASIISLLAFAANAILADVKPGNIWGLTYGTLATVLLAGTGLYGVRRRGMNTASRLRLGVSFHWVQFHVYGGALFLLMVFMHTGFRLPSGALNWWLWLASVGVTVSGLFGVLIQKWIPKLLTSGLSIEVIYERIPQLTAEIRERVTQLVAGKSDPLKDFVARDVEPQLVAPHTRMIYLIDITGGIQSQLRRFDYVKGFLPPDEHATLAELQQLYRTKLELDAHFTLQRVLRNWLYTHMPLSLLLTVLVLIHLFAVLYF